MPETFNFTLPSGREITMRYPDLWEIVFDESIPDPLAGLVEGLIKQTQNTYGMVTAEQQEEGKTTVSAASGDDSTRLIQLIVERSVVSPTIVTAAAQGRELKRQGKDVLHINAVLPNDALAIFYRSLGAGESLAKLFLGIDSTDDDLESVHDLAEDLSAAVEPAGSPV